MSQLSCSESEGIPPKITRAASLPLFVAVVTCMAVVGAGAVLYFFNPSKYGFYPVCEFHELTGLNCPGCGGTRAAYQLLHGHVLQSLHDNALFLLSLVVLTGRGTWIAIQRARNRRIAVFLTPALLWVFLVTAIVFTVLRNLPVFSFLSP